MVFARAIILNLKSFLTYRILDNKSKHILNVRGTEKLSPEIMKNIDYYIDVENGEIKATEIINESFEEQLQSLTIDILDYLIEKAQRQNYDNRKYVDLKCDPEIPSRYNTELSESCEISEDDILKLTNKTIKQDDGSTPDTDVKMESSAKPRKELYLMGLYRFTAPTGTTFIKVSSFAFKSISVFNGKKKIGTYRLQDKTKNSKYKGALQTIHFSKYNLE